MTEEEARELHRVIIEIAKEQDQRADEMLDIILRLEDLKRGFSFLLDQTSQRLLERNMTELMEEEQKRRSGRGWWNGSIRSYGEGQREPIRGGSRDHFGGGRVGFLSENTPPGMLLTLLESVRTQAKDLDSLTRGVLREALVSRLKEAGISSPSSLADKAFASNPEIRNDTGDSQGRSLILSDPDPWPEPVDGA